MNEEVANPDQHIADPSQPLAGVPSTHMEVPVQNNDEPLHPVTQENPRSEHSSDSDTDSADTIYDEAAASAHESLDYVSDSLGSLNATTSGLGAATPSQPMPSNVILDTPTQVQKEMQIVSKFWGDVADSDEEVMDTQNIDPPFEVALSKSAKKKIKKRKLQASKAISHNTHSRAGPRNRA